MGYEDRSSGKGFEIGMRNILVVAHTRREDSLAAALSVSEQLVAADISPVMTESDYADFVEYSKKLGREISAEIRILNSEVATKDIELAMVLGGDGTILKAAEIVRDSSVALMGVNLGHVGFLAESERDELASSVAHAVAKNYVIKERMTLNVDVIVDSKKVFSTWALNEATVEKSARERMLEVVIEVEGSPLSSFGCDGIVVSTPTGSTAYAFSAGGPVVWPEVEAILMVPLSAHALFARPMVIKPSATIAVEVLRRSAGHGILWCDGRRSWELPPGARVEVSQSGTPVRLARLRDASFTDRLVRKFALPVAGWRGSAVESAK
jgi:NAD+ kinase